MTFQDAYGFTDRANRPSRGIFALVGQDGMQSRRLIELAQHAIVLPPVRTHLVPDPGDQHLWEPLAARPDLRLVTGDKLLLDDATMRPRLLTAEAFVASWR